MTAKRFTIPELESELVKKRRIANEATLAAECRFKVEYKPSTCLHGEGVLPAKMQPSRGHLFAVEFLQPRDWENPLKLDAWLDDRGGEILGQLAEHLRGIAEAFSELASDVESARLKGGGA